jgi:hypothetical protein
VETFFRISRATTHRRDQPNRTERLSYAINNRRRNDPVLINLHAELSYQRDLLAMRSRSMSKDPKVSSSGKRSRLLHSAA